MVKTASVVRKMARILVIDDDPEVRTLLERILRTAGHSVLLAADGGEGLRQLSANDIDLVITDLYMPNKEGLETIAELRKRSPEVPILAISGHPAANTMLSIAGYMGTAAVLQKPFSCEEVLKTIARIV